VNAASDGQRNGAGAAEGRAAAAEAAQHGAAARGTMRSSRRPLAQALAQVPRPGRAAVGFTAYTGIAGWPWHYRKRVLGAWPQGSESVDCARRHPRRRNASRGIGLARCARDLGLPVTLSFEPLACASRTACARHARHEHRR
jgi:hypothetical protein